MIRSVAVAFAAALVLAPSPLFAQTADPALAAIVGGPERDAANSARDRYRHPEATLSFFGVKPDSVVVEILPGGSGYWTEILAPYLKDHGRYIAAVGDRASTSQEAQKNIAAFTAKFVAAPERYGAIEVTQFSGDKYPIAAPGSADFVLTFRNIHNWMAAGEAEAAFKTFYNALKPGGVLGLEEHRARADQPRIRSPRAATSARISRSRSPSPSASSSPDSRRSTPIQKTPRIIPPASGPCRRRSGSRTSTATNTRRSAKATASPSNS